MRTCTCITYFFMCVCTGGRLGDVIIGYIAGTSFRNCRAGTHLHTYIQIHAHTHAWMKIYTCQYMHTYMNTFITHTYMQTYIHPNKHSPTYTHTCITTYTDTYIHTYRRRNEYIFYEYRRCTHAFIYQSQAQDSHP